MSKTPKITVAEAWLLEALAERGIEPQYMDGVMVLMAGMAGEAWRIAVETVCQHASFQKFAGYEYPAERVLYEMVADADRVAKKYAAKLKPAEPRRVRIEWVEQPEWW